jgi:ferredoxin-type protein NapH
MIKKKSRRFVRRLTRWRVWVQTGFLLFWLNPLLLFWPGLRWVGICSPVFHCYSCPLASFACPIGILANYSALHIFPFLAAGTLLMTGAVFGSLICGWVCPFGFLQDLVGRIPTPKIRLRGWMGLTHWYKSVSITFENQKIRLPGWMGLTRYAVLVGLVLVIPYFYGSDDNSVFICKVCPAGALEASVPYSSPWSPLYSSDGQWNWRASVTDWHWKATTVKTVILVTFVLTMLFTWRPWCTLFCPLGAIFSLCNYVSLMFLRFQPTKCHDCDLCADLCKYRGPSERRGSDMRCIRCLECVKCNALSVGTVFQKRENVPPEK